MKERKPEIKEGQVWYCASNDDVIVIYNKKLIIWGQQKMIFINQGRCHVIYCLVLEEDFNIKKSNWHYVGEL